MPATGDPPAIVHEDFVFALTQVDSFTDVTEDDLLHIYDIVNRRHHEHERRAADAWEAISPPGPRESS